VWRALLALVVLAACGGDGILPPDAAPGSTVTTSVAAIADGVHFGTVAALEPARFRLELDEAELLGGADARRAAEEDGGVLTRGGHYVRDAGREPVAISLSPQLRVRLLVPCCELHRVAFDGWLDGFEPDARSFFGTSRSYYEVTVTDGKVVTVDEVQVT
jgi:hypothetical protein